MLKTHLFIDGRASNYQSLIDGLGSDTQWALHTTGLDQTNSEWSHHND